MSTRRPLLDYLRRLSAGAADGSFLTDSTGLTIGLLALLLTLYCIHRRLSSTGRPFAFFVALLWPLKRWFADWTNVLPTNGNSLVATRNMLGQRVHSVYSLPGKSVGQKLS